MVVQDAAACLHPQPFVFPAPAASVSECESPLQLSFISSFSPYLALTFLISLFSCPAVILDRRTQGPVSDPSNTV